MATQRAPPSSRPYYHHLVRALGPSGFGTFALALGITGLLTRPSDLGTTQSAARFVAERHGDTQGVVGVLGMALKTRLATAIAIAVVVFALAGPISNVYGAPELAWPLRGAAIALFGQSVFRFFATIFIALRLTSRGLTLVLSESAMEFTASVTLVLIGGGATGAAFGRALGYPVRRPPRPGSARQAARSFTVVRHRPQPGWPAGIRELRRGDVDRPGAWSAFSQIDVLLIGAFLSASCSWHLQCPLRLIAFLGSTRTGPRAGVGPRLARHPQERPQVAALERAIRYIVMAQAAAAIRHGVGGPDHGSRFGLGVLGLSKRPQGIEPLRLPQRPRPSARDAAQLHGRGKTQGSNLDRHAARQCGDRHRP